MSTPENAGQPCTFPRCEGRYHAEHAPGETGWVFPANEPEDIPVHDHAVQP